MTHKVKHGSFVMDHLSVKITYEQKISTFCEFGQQCFSIIVNHLITYVPTTTSCTATQTAQRSPKSFRSANISHCQSFLDQNSKCDEEIRLFFQVTSFVEIRNLSCHSLARVLMGKVEALQSSLWRVSLILFVFL